MLCGTIDAHRTLARMSLWCAALVASDSRWQQYGLLSDTVVTAPAWRCIDEATAIAIVRQALQSSHMRIQSWVCVLRYVSNLFGTRESMSPPPRAGTLFWWPSGTTRLPTAQMCCSYNCFVAYGVQCGSSGPSPALAQQDWSREKSRLRNRSSRDFCKPSRSCAITLISPVCSGYCNQHQPNMGAAAPAEQHH
ncbi:hypothetical protein JKP88DRAFT_253765 [Tribonema minus]|uniref:Uncharacterized protein n=1 Tax=Tribonema minus TaxID=303371 RepID=A0A836CJS1_9STRA|nr:hypothetical protein JKP88DRAFT_253765 [Tribonema minus]